MSSKQTFLGFLLLLLAHPAARADVERKRVAGEVEIIVALDKANKTIVFIRKKHVAALKLKQAVEIADDLKITHAGTCMLLKQPDGSMEAVPATTIPMEPAKHFGWIFLADTTRKKLAYEEFFTVPENPNWNTKVTVSGDPLTAREAFDEPVWDWLWHRWFFEAGDPTGKHRFTLKIEEKTITLDFDIVPKKPAPSP
jgi:hypothetical protein